MTTNRKRKRPNTNSLFGRVPRRKPFLTKKNMAAQLRFETLHLNKTQDFWNNVPWTDETKAEMSGDNAQFYIWCGLGLFCCHRTWTPCNHWVDQQTHGMNWVRQQDYFPKYSSKFTTDWLEKKRIRVLQCFRPDIKMQWWDIKRAVQKWMPANLNWNNILKMTYYAPFFFTISHNCLRSCWDAWDRLWSKYLLA